MVFVPVAHAAFEEVDALDVTKRCEHGVEAQAYSFFNNLKGGIFLTTILTIVAFVCSFVWLALSMYLQIKVFSYCTDIANSLTEWMKEQGEINNTTAEWIKNHDDNVKQDIYLHIGRLQADVKEITEELKALQVTRDNIDGSPVLIDNKPIGWGQALIEHPIDTTHSELMEITTATTAKDKSTPIVIQME